MRLAIIVTGTIFFAVIIKLLYQIVILQLLLNYVITTAKNKNINQQKERQEIQGTVIKLM